MSDTATPQVRTKEQIQAEIDALETEESELMAWLADVEKNSNSKRERLRTIKGSWGSQGEIGERKRELRDIEFPVFKENNGWNRATRIIEVSDKWISLREDGCDEITYYSASTGYKKHSKSEWRKIDAEKATKLWYEHITGKGNQP